MRTTSGHVYEFGPFTLETAEGRLSRDGNPIRVPPKALDLLTVLVERAGRVVAKEELLAAVWPATFVEEGNVAVNVNMLRRALADEGGQSFIETVSKRGYRFVHEVRLREPERVPVSAAPIEQAPLSHVLTDPVLAPVAPKAFGYRGWALAASLVVLGVMAATFLSRQRNATEITGVRSLIVAPFRGGADGQSHLEGGMAEALSTRLASLDQLRVPPLAAIRPDEDPFDAGGRLGVDAVLTGSVQRVGERLRVTAQLSRTGDRATVWSSNFDERFTEIFQVQDRIAARIAASLSRVLTTETRAALSRHETDNAEAYDLYLRAREQWANRTPAATHNAIKLYEQAIAIDPNFARAYAGLANCYNLTNSGMAPAVRYPLAKAAAEKAVQLDDQSAEAHTALAFMLYKFEWKWEDSEREFKRALALDANDALALQWYAGYLGIRGRHDEAVAMFDRALARDPDSLPIRVDSIRPLLNSGRPAEARAVAEAGLALNPSWGQMLIRMAEVLEVEGRFGESIEMELRGLLIRGASVPQLDAQRAAHRSGGIRKLLLLQIEQFKQSLETGALQTARFGVSSQIAYAYARLGDREQTLQWLLTAINLNEDAALQLKSNHWFSFLKAEPRYVALMERVGL